MRVCREYKTATNGYAFELNGRLKSGLSIDNFLPDLPYLRRIICAKLDRSLTLYRMSSDYEFSASVLQLLERKFTYQAFMSTSDATTRLGKFVPTTGRPLLLEIECPSGTVFAPLDLFPGIDEDEYLLGCGTSFTVIGEPILLCGHEVHDYIPLGAPEQLTVLTLQVAANPAYVEPKNIITLSD